ncbi:hypothetical protein [Methanosarcina barkeri]|uniref:hypothetical protein n=1 Tax=Methanosarcina barkeri TaxID=2208 RepID=UPI001FB535C7|nr:hypothetical protein [Methanosarcina barkeri]
MNPENHKKGKDKFNAEETVSRLYPYIFRVFDVYEVQNSGEALYFYGTPRTNTENVTGELWEPLQHFGFGCTLKYELGEYVLLVFPEKKAKEKNWINLVLFIATFFYNHGLRSLDVRSRPRNRSLPAYPRLTIYPCDNDSSWFP